MITTFYCKHCFFVSHSPIWVMMFSSLMISLLVGLFNNTVICVFILYVVDTLYNNDCWICLGVGFFLPPNRNHTQIYLHIYKNTTVSLPFEECALLLFYISYINIYKEAFCKWTSIAYMLVRMNSP